MFLTWIYRLSRFVAGSLHAKQAVRLPKARPPVSIPTEAYFCVLFIVKYNFFQLKPCNFYESGYNRLYYEG